MHQRDSSSTRITELHNSVFNDTSALARLEIGFQVLLNTHQATVSLHPASNVEEYHRLFTFSSVRVTNRTTMTASEFNK